LRGYLPGVGTVTWGIAVGEIPNILDSLGLPIPRIHVFFLFPSEGAAVLGLSLKQSDTLVALDGHDIRGSGVTIIISEMPACCKLLLIGHY